MKKISNLLFALPLFMGIGIFLVSCSSVPQVDSDYKTSKEWNQIYQVESYAPNNQISNNDYSKDLAVKCENGTYVGKEQNDVKQWKGIQYAKQPVGELRFAPAQNPDKSDNVYEAYHFGNSCMQAPSDNERASLYHQGEDCLSLNVWSSINGNITNKPVLVYIHGGGWISGGSSDPLYDGYNFAHYNPDICVVTINYRVGMMGQINLANFPDAPADDAYLNNGLLDQIQALKWIKANIAGFGGDGNNITICGESAGAGAVSLLTVMPEAKGLFQKAIPMSGGTNQAQSKSQTNNLTDALKKDLNVKSVKDLNNVPFDKLCKWWNENGEGVAHQVIRGTSHLSDNPLQEYENGAAKDIKFLQGSTSDEFAYYQAVFHDEKNLYIEVCKVMTEAINKDANDEAKQAFEEYKAALNKLGYTDEQIPLEFASDKSLEFINVYQSEVLSQQGGHGYCYVFDVNYDGEYSYIGAGHALDCHYLFGNFDGNHANGNKEEVDLSRTLQRMFSNFVSKGDPTIEGKTWSEYNTATRCRMIFDLNSQGGVRQETNYHAERTIALNKIMNNNYKFRFSTATLGTLIGIAAQKETGSYISFALKEYIIQLISTSKE